MQGQAHAHRRAGRGRVAGRVSTAAATRTARGGIRASPAEQGGYLGHEPYDFLNAIAVVFVLAAVWPLARRFSLAYAAFILINILPPLSAGGLMSAGRFSAVMFPAFLWFVSAVPAAHRMGWIAAFAALEAFNAALFYTWRPLF